MYNETSISTSVTQTEIDLGLRRYMLSVYNKMSLALAVTAIVAFLGSIFLTPLMTTPIWYVFVFAPIGLVLALSYLMDKVSVSTAYIMFFAFACLMGISMSTIFVTYTSESIAKVFFITAATFAGASLYGYTTNRDLTSMGNFLIMGVIGLVVASLVNVFLASSLLGWIVSVIGVIAFTGLTAYDTQKLKEEYYSNGEVFGFESIDKSSIFGALTLYLDVINIFTSLMTLLGNKEE